MADLLPPNSTPLERNLSAVAARIGELPTPLRDMLNPDTCPANLLPWLASWLSVDTWDASWTDAQKRAVIKASVRVHRRKGTVSAVRDVLQAADADVALVEWWQQQPKGTPHTFRLDVEIEDRGITEETLNSIEGQVASVKPVRSSFTTRLIGRTRSKLYIGAATFSGEVTEVLPHRITLAEGPRGALFLAIGWWEYSTTTVYPQGA